MQIFIYFLSAISQLKHNTCYSLLYCSFVNHPPRFVAQQDFNHTCGLLICWALCPQALLKHPLDLLKLTQIRLNYFKHNLTSLFFSKTKTSFLSNFFAKQREHKFSTKWFKKRKKNNSNFWWNWGILIP